MRNFANYLALALTALSTVCFGHAFVMCFAQLPLASTSWAFGISLLFGIIALEIVPDVIADYK